MGEYVALAVFIIVMIVMIVHLKNDDDNRGMFT